MYTTVRFIKLRSKSIFSGFYLVSFVILQNVKFVYYEGFIMQIGEGCQEFATASEIL